MVKASFFSFFVFLLLTNLSAQHSVRLEIKSLPPNPAAPVTLYAAGSFNGWNPKEEQYKFTADAQGHYYLILKTDAARPEYKITRGSWNTTECSMNGAGKANRVLDLLSDTTIGVQIEAWADQFAASPASSTAGQHVCIIDTAFFIPQLNRIRKIWIYLPPSYCDGNKKKYPVLYMQDGQNLFDAATSYAGEWGIDEFLDTTSARECIVIGIDHAGEKRNNEYNPYDNVVFGKGEGDRYASFLVKTLKPFIDRAYRTYRNRENTFISGSSMGGLFSMYAILKYPKVFGAAGIFSPSFWIAGTKIFSDIKTKGKKVKSRIYFYGGKQEGETMVPGILHAFEELSAVSKSTMRTVIRDEGKHNESTWRNEFPLFYFWLLQ